MTKAILLALAAVGGGVLGVLVFAVIDFSLHPSFANSAPGMWTEYGPLAVSGIGAIGGLVIGWAACASIKKPQLQAAAPTAIPPTGEPGKSRRNIRPLTWLYRV